MKDLIEKAKTKASAFSVDEGFYLFSESELNELLTKAAEAERANVVNEFVNKGYLDSNTPLVSFDS